MFRIHRIGAAAAVAVIIAVLVSPHPGGAAPQAAFTLIAGQTPANGGINFNGVVKGFPVITVPVGAEVQITLTNKGDLPHSLQIIKYSTQPPATAVAQPAFPGAQTPNPQNGILKGQTAVAKFTAATPGKYLLICGFPGHALLGMYGTFVVSASASAKASLVTK